MITFLLSQAYRSDLIFKTVHLICLYGDISRTTRKGGGNKLFIDGKIYTDSNYTKRKVVITSVCIFIFHDNTYTGGFSIAKKNRYMPFKHLRHFTKYLNYASITYLVIIYNTMHIFLKRSIKKIKRSKKKSKV